MAWNDADETIIAGTGQVYVATVGSALPANSDTSLAAATWTGLGYHTEDGVSVSHTPDVAEFGAWQSRNPVRIERQSNDFQITFALEQWNDATLPVVFGGGSVTDLGGSLYKYTPPDDDDAIDEKSVVVDVDDGTTRLRFVVTRGVVTESVESQFTRSAMAVLPVTIRALEPSTGGDAWYVLSDSAAFATGS